MQQLQLIDLQNSVTALNLLYMYTVSKYWDLLKRWALILGPAAVAHRMTPETVTVTYSNIFLTQLQKP